MSMTKCKYCDDEHVCHAGNSHEDTKTIENILFYLGYRIGSGPPPAFDVRVPARDLLDLITGEKTLNQLTLEPGEQL
jgi:hypothetical protein